jgi:uncharacterized protein
MSEKLGKWALITGASSGIGEVFGRKLAHQGYNLVLTARREERLESLKNELEAAAGIEVIPLKADLADLDGIKKVEKIIENLGGVDILINNAGFGIPSRFSETPVEKTMEMLEVHITATVRLCRQAAPFMVRQNSGVIINVSSVAAFSPGNSIGVYGASKLFVNGFSEMLASELSGHNVVVQALCPGFTHTEFHEDPLYQKYKTRTPKFLWMSSEQVVRESLNALKRGSGVYIPGFKNRFIAYFSKRGWVKKIVSRFKRRLVGY